MTATPTKNALLVHAHPEPESFSAAQLRAAEAELRAGGYTVTVLDLYAADWAPVLARAEFEPVDGPFKPQAEQQRALREDTLSPILAEHLERLLAADLLVLSFPLWWFSVPAILKGWIDRVFMMGALFGGEYGIFGEAALRGRRALLLVTTGGSMDSLAPGGRYGAITDFLYHVHRGMLEFVGYDVLDPVITYGPAHLSDEQRAIALDAVRKAFATLDARPSLAER